MVSLIVACQRPGVLATGPLPIWLHFIHQLKGERERERSGKRGQREGGVVKTRNPAFGRLKMFWS